jgi:hypothetical protein
MGKTYKFHEAIEMLGKNKDLKFERCFDRCGKWILQIKDNVIVHTTSGDDSIDSRFFFIEDLNGEYKLLSQSITFQEALDAFVAGKGITYIPTTGYQTQPRQNYYTLNEIHELMKLKWFIVD